MYKLSIISILISCLNIYYMSAKEIILEKGNFRITIPENVDKQVLLATQTLAKDIQKVMGFTPSIGSSNEKEIALCIVQADKEGADKLLTLKKS